MRRSLIRSVGPGMALLALGLLASAVVELGCGELGQAAALSPGSRAACVATFPVMLP